MHSQSREEGQVSKSLGHISGEVILIQVPVARNTRTARNTRDSMGKLISSGHTHTGRRPHPSPAHCSCPADSQIYYS